MNSTATFLSSSFSAALNSRACFASIFSPPRRLKTLKLPPFFANNRTSKFVCFSSFSMNKSDMDADAGTYSVSGGVAPKPKPWLIVGLGNPGKKYSGTRHNVGFEMVDTIAEAEGISISSVSYRALFGKGFIGNVPVILAKPQTYMNLSGESVSQIVSYYKIPLQQVLVIFDDMDLPFGKLRLLPKGGHGGQNGMRNIIDRFKGNRDFPRLRIGIGRPPGKMDPVNYVLRKNVKRFESLEYCWNWSFMTLPWLNSVFGMAIKSWILPSKSEWRQYAFFYLKESIRVQRLLTVARHLSNSLDNKLSYLSGFHNRPSVKNNVSLLEERESEWRQTLDTSKQKLLFIENSCGQWFRQVDSKF
ncbi:hypothetical protein V2J09_019415 [Rumex salicifolius]